MASGVMEGISPLYAIIEGLRGKKGKSSGRTSAQSQSELQSFKRGGTVRGHGPKMAIVHGGERVLTKKQAKRHKGRGGGRY